MTVTELPAVSRTLPVLLAEHAAANPDGTFLVTDDARVSWQEMLGRAAAAGAGFARAGVALGDTVVLALGNRAEFFDAWFGLAMLGAVEVPVSPDLVGPRLVHVLNHSGARVAVVEPAVARQLEAVGDQLTSLEHLVVVGDGASPAFPSAFRTSAFAALPCEPESVWPVPQEDDLAALLYTSGSTGPPKGVMIPYGQHCTNGRQAMGAAGIRPDDVIFLCLPLHHNMAQGYGVWPALLAGCSIRVVPKFDRHRFWDDVRASGATVWPFVGGLLALLAELPEEPGDAANPLRVAYGVPVPGSLHRAFEARFGIELVHGYGSTEATIPVWSTGGDCPVGAAGRVLPTFDVRVLDDHDREVPAGTVGEICVRPKEPYTMFQGYFHDAARTAAAWRNLWFHSGDRGSFDRQGFLWFRGRAGDVIRRFGEFVDAEEVEVASLAHPDVVQAASVGVPDEVAGEEILLAVVLRAGARVSAPALRAWVADRLPRFAVPRYVEVVPSLPLTPTGKVERYKLRQRGLSTATNDVRAMKGYVS